MGSSCSEGSFSALCCSRTPSPCSLASRSRPPRRLLPLSRPCTSIGLVLARARQLKRRRRNHICMHEYRHVLNPAAACHVEEAAAHSKVTSAVSSRALLVSSVSRSLSQLAPPPARSVFYHTLHFFF